LRKKENQRTASSNYFINIKKMAVFVKEPEVRKTILKINKSEPRLYSNIKFLNFFTPTR
jgi:hypothetical protein